MASVNASGSSWRNTDVSFDQPLLLAPGSQRECAALRDRLPGVRPTHRSPPCPPEGDLQHDLEHFAELADHINSLMKQGQMLEAIGRNEFGR